MILYFLAGHRNIKEDLKFMNRFQKFCNIIPVIARGDSYTLPEIKEMKKDFMENACASKIEFFDLNEV